jgi:hypothetical protein
MGLKAMLAVDLNFTTEDARKNFDRELALLEWEKVKVLASIWHASFKDTATDSEIITTAKNDVAKAAKKAGIASYDAGVIVSHTPPAFWQHR